MDLKAVVVPGEAPESDDESVNVTTGPGFQPKRILNPCGTIIPGEAPESDDDGTTSLSSISGAVEAIVCPPYTEARVHKSNRHTYKYNSLLHKKLRDCHQMLDKDLTEICESVIGKNIQELTSANRQLLRSELTLQEAASQLRDASVRSKNVANALLNVTEANFFHSIKI
ncbi:biogenesis of lysosome-related organelles complex 1 subunit 3 [Neodiprion pinetum]|uniref:biogenesis of lysosome-related organelles complex 1 subunit 3 n=1 Tax=Neodiprion pinetum TaxID=441929 RepID=UPI001EE071AF|nr:uncharacterized protein LOC124220252 isoform X1 [Neodiprion pinetum]